MIFEPIHWKKMNARAVVEFAEGRENNAHPKPKGSFLVFRKHLSPLDVYRYLCGRFGKPNGLMTLFKNQNDSDNLFHWDFLLAAEPHTLWIQGGNRDVHVYVTNKEMSDQDWVDFTQAMKSDFRRCASDMKDIKQRLEKWDVVSNRFNLIAGICAGFHETLIEEVDEPSYVPKSRKDYDGVRSYVDHVSEIAERSSHVFGAALSLDLLTPILSESFVNLLIFILRKDDLKRNIRQYDQYVRQPIDTRVFDLHLKCLGFSRGVDQESDDYRAFKRVMDRRNDNLHGNVNLSKDKLETVFFDGYVPLYERGADPLLELLRKKEGIFDISGTIERYHEVHAFFAYLLDLLEPDVRFQVDQVISESTFGYDHVRNIAGRLFSKNQAMMLAPYDYDDELSVDW